MSRTLESSVARFRFRWLVTLLSLAAVGCGNEDYWHAETEPVQGKIRINGQVPAGAVVTLYPTGEAVDIRESKPWGVVGEDGVYRLRTYGKEDGAPLGEYDVTFVWREDPSVMGSPDQLAGAYADPATSQWRFTIEEGQTELPPIEVKEAKVQKPQSRRSPGPSPFDDAAIAD